MSIHDHLKQLLPVDFSSIPTDDAGITDYIRTAVSHLQTVVDSVPPPPQDFVPSAASSSNVASSGDEVISTSQISSDTPSVDPAMRKAWGKPMKLSQSSNPMHVAVYKMAAGDRRGAWFARRSVHEGLGFARWKRALDYEFEESLAVHGEPGVGNVRGIGGEQKIVERKITGVGELGVMHLTAKFPGPSTPRDFVELLVSSTIHPDEAQGGVKGERKPRQYLLMSRPCTHPDVPEKSGFVRGQYESVEFIREIPVRKTQAMSTASLPTTVNGSDEAPEERQTETQKGCDRSRTDTDAIGAKAGQISAENAEATIEGNKARGQDVAQGSSNRGTVDMGVDEDGELSPHPVEWIMITRSDPGGSVPKFMVERGTPGAIVSDAGKFLEWATHKEMPVLQQEVDGTKDEAAVGEVAAGATTATAAAQHAHRASLTRTVSNHSSSSSSSDSSDSFVSAGSGAPTITPRVSTDSTGTGFDKYAHQEAELQKRLDARKAKEGAKLEEKKAKYGHDDQKMARYNERHAKKVLDADNWYEKEVAKVQGRRAKEVRKQAQKERKELDKAEASELRSEVEKLRLENEQLKAELEKLKVSGL